MIALIQRVSEASVRVGDELAGAIGPGLLALIGVERGDGPEQAQRLADRVLAYRVFEDAGGRMNLDVRQANGELLLVPQFTLAADTRSGNRPSFTPAAPPAEGEALFEVFVAAVRAAWPRIATGRFGANMAVSLVNQGPVTFWLQVQRPPAQQQ